MFEIKADPEANLLTINFSGRVGPDETKASLQRAPEILSRLQPGFRLLTNLTGLDSLDFACAPDIERLMDLCHEAGVARVIRIIPDPRKDIGLNIMSRFHYPRHIPIATCETEAEALNLLSD